MGLSSAVHFYIYKYRYKDYSTISISNILLIWGRFLNFLFVFKSTFSSCVAFVLFLFYEYVWFLEHMGLVAECYTIAPTNL